MTLSIIGLGQEIFLESRYDLPMKTQKRNKHDKNTLLVTRDGHLRSGTHAVPGGFSPSHSHGVLMTPYDPPCSLILDCIK